MASRGGTAFAAAMLAVGGWSFPATAGATAAWLQIAAATLQSESGRRVPVPKVARYVIDEGGIFVLDLRDRAPLMKFDDSPEVLVLYSARGPRGDIIYRDELGEPILRATKLGGMTVFTSRRPEGSAATLLGPANPIQLAPLGPVILYQRLVQASVRCSRLAQHLIGFDAPSADASSDAIIADAAAMTTVAVGSLATRPGGRPALARLARVNFVQGLRPAANLQNGVLTIVIAPSLGVAGRPSSKRILQAMGAR